MRSASRFRWLEFVTKTIFLLHLLRRSDPRSSVTFSVTSSIITLSTSITIPIGPQTHPHSFFLLYHLPSDKYLRLGLLVEGDKSVVLPSVVGAGHGSEPIKLLSTAELETSENVRKFINMIKKNKILSITLNMSHSGTSSINKKTNSNLFIVIKLEHSWQN